MALLLLSYIDMALHIGRGNKGENEVKIQTQTDTLKKDTLIFCSSPHPWVYFALPWRNHTAIPYTEKDIIKITR